MTEPALYATVAVDQPVDATYTYAVPSNWSRSIRVGSRVTVPLGRGNRLSPGTVLELSATMPAAAEKRPSKTEDAQELEDLFLFDSGPEIETRQSGIKQLVDVMEDVPPIPVDLLELAKWISSYYCAPIGMTLAGMLPSAVKKATRIPANLMISLAAPEIPPSDQLAGQKIAPRTRAAFESLHAFLQSGAKLEQEVLIHADISRPLLKRLLALNLLRAERQIQLPEHLPPGANLQNQQPKIDKLMPEQEQALAQIVPLLAPDAGFAVRLIHGVTGSGKTELYIRAIEQAVTAGKRAIVLVPEISLTPQTVRRFTARFPRVAVLHSGLKDSERHQHWHAIATGWAQVIVGARSAIFAPVSDLGVIIVDEEHDPSYKQDSLPKYHGRDVAIRRAQLLNVPVLLGSATPALESWHNAHHNPPWGGANGVARGLISLRSRPLGTQMPRVAIVDMKAEAKRRRGLHILSTTLEHQLKQTLDAKKQAIFLLNRRGYAHYLLCPRCDWVLMCDNCDATMVVHRTKEAKGGKSESRASSKSQDSGLKTQNSLRSAVQDSVRGLSKAEIRHTHIEGTVQCHYCLTSMILPESCPLCQARLTHLGQGTQRAEDELMRKFPHLRLKRMDSDSMTNLGEYQKSLDAFGNGELDLLIGTQMISKGLDFPNVALVGVLNADLAMVIPDFRAAERTFQLICQVAGRSGRDMGGGADGSAEGGRGVVVVQTFQPTEPAIAHACNHDYLGFVQSELPHRKEFGYPPYGRLVRIVLSHKSYSTVHAAADALARLITALTHKLHLPIRMLGPLPPPMGRLMELYRVELIMFADTALPLQRLLGSLRARGALVSGKVSVAVDVDPLHML